MGGGHGQLWRTIFGWSTLFGCRRIFAPVAFRVRTYGLDVGRAGQAWVDHMLKLPAMLAWENDALKESWREIGHEEELAACGKIIADYRQM